MNDIHISAVDSFHHTLNMLQFIMETKNDLS